MRRHFAHLLRAFLLSLLFLGPGPLQALGPVFDNPNDLASEHELSRYMSDFNWAWRDQFRSAETAYRATGGSLNIRHLFIEQNLKVRFPIAEERFWFRFRHDRLKSLQRRDQETQIEMEWRTWGHWYLSLLGEPTFEKAEATAGGALRLGPDEAHSIKFTYLLPNFDTNYAFHNKTVDQGFEEFFRHHPQDRRLSFTWIEDPWSLFVEGRWVRPWEREHRDLTAPFTQYVERADVSQAVWDLRRRWSEWTLSLEGDTWRSRESIHFDPVVPTENRRASQERTMLRSSIQRDLSSGSWWRVGSGYVVSRGRLRFSNQPALNEYFKDTDTLGFLLFFKRFNERVGLESGYVYDNLKEHKDEPTGTQSEHRSHNRLKLGLHLDWGGRGSLRLITGWELDKQDFGKFAFFDGGTIQFQAAF